MKTKLEYAKALEIANGVVEDLRPYCERIEIAGSLRRQKPEIGDIEIVAIPRYSDAGLDLFGQPIPARSLLDEYIGSYQLEKNGPKYKKLILKSIDVDLFLTTPECWGVIFTIRTGSADFSHWLVTHKHQGGALPGYMQVTDGRVWNSKGEALDTPEEKDFFEAIHIPWIDPDHRIEGSWSYGK